MSIDPELIRGKIAELDSKIIEEISVLVEAFVALVAKVRDEMIVTPPPTTQADPVADAPTEETAPVEEPAAVASPEGTNTEQQNPPPPPVVGIPDEEPDTSDL